MRMPIRFHLNGQRFDSETIRVMGLAYEITLISLRLFDRDDIANDVVAHKIIEQANAGERDPERLCAAVVQQWGRAIAHRAAHGSGRALIAPLRGCLFSKRRNRGCFRWL
jgi:hypothetical protein